MTSPNEIKSVDAHAQYESEIHVISYLHMQAFKYIYHIETFVTE